ncbi:helicase-associated domain-containing protein [Paenibacillus sp. FSL H8-0034]|uniref:helicase-associated domain-containing protein n=1 Tax=Paenibacillus sp. FSL H8-0034 TaxID=2954671 RepID=UPI0030F96027
MNHAYFLGRMEPGFIKKLETERIYAPWIQQGYPLVTIWSDIEIMKSIYGQLSERECRLLQLLVTHVGCEPFDWPKLERITHSLMSGAEARVGLLLLVEKGFLYALRKSWGEQLYVMAHDGLAMWQQILWNPDQERLFENGDEHHAPVRKEQMKDKDIELTDQGGTGLVHNIFQSMVYMNQNEMRLTKSGTLSKRTLHKWKELLPLNDDTFKACGIKYAYMNVYSESIAVILDFMIRLQIVRQQAEELVLQAEEIRRWLRTSEAEQNKRLYLLWKELMFPAESWLQHAVLWLERLPNEDWISGDDILRWLKDCEVIPLNSVLHDEMLVEQLEAGWLNPLLAFGWLEKGVSRQEQAHCYRWSQHPLAPVVSKDESEPYLYIQPDFEVLVPPNVGFAVRWELTAMADHRYTDSMSLYHITKKSLQRGIQTGRRVEHILAFLERYSADGIPEHVQFTIDQWAGELGFKEDVFDVDKETTIIMDISELTTPELESYPQLTHRTGFLDSRHSYIQLEMELQMPSLAELYPELRAVPTAWMKEYRTYHTSTRREITLKAMEWKTSLQIRGNGIDRVIIPRTLQEIDASWKITGFEVPHGNEINLFFSDCEEMRIIVPGVYEKY